MWNVDKPWTLISHALQFPYSCLPSYLLLSHPPPPTHLEAAHGQVQRVGVGQQRQQALLVRDVAHDDLVAKLGTLA